MWLLTSEIYLSSPKSTRVLPPMCPLLTLSAHARVTVVVLCVCLSVCHQASSYIPQLQVQKRYHKVLYGVPNASIVWILPIPFSLPVMALFAVSTLLDLI